MKLSKPYWIGVLIVLAAAGAMVFASMHTIEPIKVGVLHSLSGNMAANERPLVDALQLAFDEINAAGGLLGRPIQPVVADCRSDADFCAREAERLISEEHVSALFGCWTSACRKAVKLVVENHHHLLFYPLQYEGMELSPNIVYVGSAPNQQIIPAVRWSLDNLGKTFYLVGSDYVFPRTANLIIKDLILSQGGKVLGEHYLPLGSSNVAPVIGDLQKLHPAVVLNTINGDTNDAFFKAFNQAGLSAKTTPIFSFSIAETGFSRLPDTAGHYAAWSYFQSLPNEVNQAFVKAFKQKYGADRTIGDPMESSYTAVHLWKLAVQSARSDKADVVNNAVSWQSLRAPGGIVVVGANTRHTWKKARIGRIRADGQFDIVWESSGLVAPEPFPRYRTREQWARLLKREDQP